MSAEALPSRPVESNLPNCSTAGPADGSTARGNRATFSGMPLAGSISIISSCSGGVIWNSPVLRACTLSAVNRPVESMAAFACAIASRSSSSAERYLTSFVTVESLTTRYGFSMKP